MTSDDQHNQGTPAPTGGLGGGLSRRRMLQVGAVVTGAAALQGLAGPAWAGAGNAPDARLAYGRQVTSFDQGWRFLRGDAVNAETLSFDDNAWRRLDVPHDWSIEDLPYATSDDGAATADPSTMAFQTTPPPAGTPTVIGPFDQINSVGGKGTGYTVSGIGWYRKHFRLPGGSLASGMRAEVRFEGVFHNATFWLNGQLLGSHLYGYTPVTFDLTPLLIKGENILAVKVDNTVPDARWYSGSGIYRHASLTLVGAVRVPSDGVYITTPTATKAHSVAQIAVEAANLGHTSEHIATKVTVFTPSGRRAGSTTSARSTVGPNSTQTFNLAVSIAGAELWSPSSPRLYAARTEILVDGKTVDTLTTTFGIRSVVWDGTSGLLINGTATKVRGACIHANYGPLGAIALNRSVERQVEILKAAGFNSIRTAHNPATPYLLDVCDRMGMLVWDEAFDHWTGTAFTPDYGADLTTFIRRDRNHPSLIVWSTGNEVSDPVLGKQLHDIVHALDPTRPATQGATPFDSAADPQYDYTDISDVHYNMTDTKIATHPHQVPRNRPMTQSESWPADIYEDWQFALDNPWFVGSWVWIGWDYIGESGSGATLTGVPGLTQAQLPPFGTGPFPWFNDYQGDLDLIGQRKPQNYWRSVVYGDSQIELFVERPAPAGKEQYAHYWEYYDELQSWTWDVPAGQLMTVHVYTTGDSVTLRLNGQNIATQAVATTDRRVAAPSKSPTPQANSAPSPTEAVTPSARRPSKRSAPPQQSD